MQYNGYNLFTTVDDEDLRAASRAKVMEEIITSNQDAEGNVKVKGLREVMGYMSKIPKGERRSVVLLLTEMLQRLNSNAT